MKPTPPRPKGSQNDDVSSSIKYSSGFGAHCVTEALPGALPKVGNTPQKCPYGLYTEQINGTAFTKAKAYNQRTWQYRIKPSAAAHSVMTKCADQGEFLCCLEPNVNTPEQLRWDPLPMPKPSDAKTFVNGLVCFAGAGDPASKGGIRIHEYTCNTSMTPRKEAFCSSDGDFLFVPQEGTLHITTESGKMDVPSGFIAVVPRGFRYSVDVDGACRGYVCEAFDNHFELPPLGVIGANGLSNPRDFEVPVASYEDKDEEWRVFHKFLGEMWQYTQDHSPFDVVAWHGNYAPYRYDLAKFNVINTVSYDHLDPSIFCVLTSQTAEFGVACCDFVIFPPRWMVAENTFRPPYYHKNIMSEFMGNVRGTYEAKQSGFGPGASSLHSPMVAHGPDVDTFEKFSNMDLKPLPPNNDHLAFMFESTYTLRLTSYAANNLQQKDYMKQAYGNFKKYFNPTQK